MWKKKTADVKTKNDIQEKAECITKLITQFGENLAQLIVQMAITPNQQSQTLAHRFCCLIMVELIRIDHFK